MLLAAVVLATGRGAAAVGALVVLGWWLWTLAEYWIHRCFMDGTGRAHPLRRSHRLHHARPDELHRATSLSVLTAFLVAVALAGGMATLLVGWWAPPVALGVAVGGCTYSWLHWRCHNAPVRARIGFEQRLREHHLYHHFVDRRANFGFSTMMWDSLWGTWRAPIALPAHLRLPVWARQSGAQTDRTGLVG